MVYIPNQTVYQDTIKVLTDKTNADMTGVKADLDSKDASISTINSNHSTHIADSSAHGATDAASPSKIIVRDTFGRAKVAAPAVAGDIANKGYVDSISTNISSHTNAGTAHGSTDLATPSAIMQRDASGRAKVVDPVAASDIANKGYVDGVQSNLTSHMNNSTAHGATSTATAGAIMSRDNNGRAKVASPQAIDDIARKDTVDVVQTNLNNHANDSSAHGAVSTATANTIMKRDTLGNAQVANPSAVGDAANKGYVDGVASVLAPAGFGLGTMAIGAVTNWNNYKSGNGFYVGTGLTNQPAGTGTSVWLVLVMVGTGGATAQQLAFNKDGSSMHSRQFDGTIWTSWRQVVRAGDTVVGNIIMDGTLNLGTGNGRLVLPVGPNKYAT